MRRIEVDILLGFLARKVVSSLLSENVIFDIVLIIKSHQSLLKSNHRAIIDGCCSVLFAVDI